MCWATVTFLHVAVGVLVPTLAACYCWRSAARPGGVAPRSRPQRLAAQAELQLRHVTMADGSGWQRALVVWFLAANLWVLCKAGAGLL